MRSFVQFASILMVLFATTIAFASAQEVGDRVRAEMRDGSRFVGQLTALTDDALTIRLTSGDTITLDRTDVQRLRVFEEVDGRFTMQDPNRTRLFFAPTARGLGQGEGYFAAYYVLLPFVAYGVTDQLTLAGGVSLIPGLGLSDQLVYVAPKATLYEKNDRSVAVGGLYGTVPSGSGGGGLAYASTTFGPSSRAFTLGAGFAFSSEGDRTSPLLVFGGEVQLSNSLKLISENYFTTASLDDDSDDFCEVFPDECEEPSITDRLLLSGGVRFFGERLAGDIAFVVFPALIDEADTFVYLPWISFAYNFGN